MFGNISQLLEMKKKAEELKAKMESIVVSETTDGITVDCNGSKQVLAIHIEAGDMQDKALLEEKLCRAVNNAMQAAEKAAMGDLAGMAGGLSGLFGK